MNKTLKYTTALSSATVALAFAVTVASADSSLVNSGNHATVDTSTNTTTSVNVSNSNTSQVSQSSTSVANSGGNSTSGNIGGSSITSGAATTSSNQQVSANQSQTGISLPASTAAGLDTTVVNTGNNLNLDNSTNQTTTASVMNMNQFAGQQQSFGMSNSGLNSSNGNIGGGSIVSGAAAVSNDFGVEANVSQTSLNLGSLGAMTGAGALGFTNTGNNANVDKSYNVMTSIGVTNANSANVSQNAWGLSNSGLNFAFGNIGSGSITSGSAAVGNDFDVMANKNSTGLAFGSSMGSSTEDLDVTNTGNGLDLNGSTNVSTSVSATSTNASVSAQTSVDVSNSGLNFGHSNIGGGALGSGNAGVWTGFMSGGNWNQTMIN